MFEKLILILYQFIILFLFLYVEDRNRNSKQLTISHGELQRVARWIKMSKKTVAYMLFEISCSFRNFQPRNHSCRVTKMRSKKQFIELFKKMTKKHFFAF